MEHAQHGGNSQNRCQGLGDLQAAFPGPLALSCGQDDWPDLESGSIGLEAPDQSAHSLTPALRFTPVFVELLDCFARRRFIIGRARHVAGS